MNLWIESQHLGYLIVVVAICLVAGVVWWLRRRSRPLTVKGLIEAISFECSRDIIIPDGMDGEIQLDYLLLTAKGVLVLDIKEVEGVVFGGNRMDDWTVISGDRRFTFRNPQGPMQDRVAAVRYHVKDVPVDGYIVFTPGAQLKGGVPDAVTSLQELYDQYRLPEADEARRVAEAFAQYWERLQAEARPVTE